MMGAFEFVLMIIGAICTLCFLVLFVAIAWSEIRRFLWERRYYAKRRDDDEYN